MCGNDWEPLVYINCSYLAIEIKSRVFKDDWNIQNTAKDIVKEPVEPWSCFCLLTSTYLCKHLIVTIWYWNKNSSGGLLRNLKNEVCIVASLSLAFLFIITKKILYNTHCKRPRKRFTQFDCEIWASSLTLCTFLKNIIKYLLICYLSKTEMNLS